MDIRENFYSRLQTIREEVEQIDELSRKTLNSYVKKSADSEKELMAKGNKEYNRARAKKQYKKAANRGRGRIKARLRLKGSYKPKSMPYSAAEE